MPCLRFNLITLMFVAFMCSSHSHAAPASAYELSSFESPDKDVTRIAKLPKTLMSFTDMQAYVEKIAAKVETVLPSNDKAMALALWTKANANKVRLAPVAHGLWMNGNYASALWLMGRACQQEPSADNFNNYAAFLLMSGGEHLALPILQKLNADFPNNSTVLNNMGQAWFGLGELNEAEKHVNSAIKIYAYHPQANVTKAVIEKQKGNDAAAVSALKRSIHKGYSPDKEAMLEELDYQVSGKDLYKKKMHVSEAALGFDKWMEAVPNFPKSLGELASQHPRWSTFTAEVTNEIAEVQQKQTRIAKNLMDEAQSKSKSKRKAPGIRMNMSAKLGHIRQYYSEKKTSTSPGTGDDPEYLVTMLDSTIQPMTQYAEKLQDIAEKYYGQPKGADCGAKKAATNAYLKAYNTITETAFKEHMKAVIRRLKADSYVLQITVGDVDELHLATYDLTLQFLQNLLIVRPELNESFAELDGEKGVCPTQIEQPKPRKLPDFDELNCQDKVKFSIALIGDYEFSCGKAQFDLDPILLPFNVHFSKNTNTNEYTSASIGIGMGPVKVTASGDAIKGTGNVAVGYTKDLGGGYLGPIPLEGSAEATVAVEISSEGISDMTVGGSVEVKAGTGTGSVSVDSGARWSTNAGGSSETKAGMGGVISRLVP